jgi:Lrp/AsnC family transcriptional regulator, leucine-responsive regulatory protein
MKQASGVSNQKLPAGQASLDTLDLRILRILQHESLIGNQALSDLIGLSPPACLKRVRRLRSAGVIERTVSLLSPDALGCSLLTIVRVKLERPTEQNMAAFEEQIMSLPAVVQCMTVSGDIDYVLMVRSRDVAHYQDFARSILATAPGIRAYTSEIVLAVNKATTEIPIDA